MTAWDESGDDPGEDRKKYQECKDRALNILSRREHSEHELTGKLLAKGVDGDTVDRVVAELKQLDYVSDRRFTESFVQSRIQRGYGPVKIQHELNAKGVYGSLVEEYLDEADPVWEETIARVWSRKYGDVRPVGYEGWAKQARFLQSRGFTSEQIRKTIAFEE